MAGFELQTISIEVKLLCHKRICLIRQNTFDVSHVSKCIRMVGSALMVSSRMFSAQVKTLKCSAPSQVKCTSQYIEMHKCFNNADSVFESPLL